MTPASPGIPTDDASLGPVTRVYVPVGWSQAERLSAEGVFEGPVRACAVDPRWRAGAPEVDEEEWEFEAQSQAADALTELGGGLVLALDVPESVLGPAAEDGWREVAGPVRRRDLAALLDADLGWYGVQELAQLLLADG